MSQRLKKIFKNLKEKNKKALISFSVAGYPDEKISLEICKALSDRGVHIHELNMPHAEAQADGPIIQLANIESIKKGINLDKVFYISEKLRSHNSDLGICLMGYLNNIFIYGIEKFAEKGDPNSYELPKPIINKGGCNLSFAGLKTAILKISKTIKTEQDKFNLAASFQKTIEEILKKKTKIAFSEFEKENYLKEKTFVVAGGVAANKKIRTMLLNLCKENDYKGIFPPIEICGDNAAMIAMVGLEKYKLKQFNKLDHPAKPRWPLDEKALFLKGAGVKL